MTAYAYLRKSVQKPGARDISHAAQEQGIRHLAERHHDNDGDLLFLTDWNLSGRLGADRRPGYAQLLDAITSGRCTAVYSYSLSRLGRSVSELGRLFDLCRSRGVAIRLVADSIDTSTASGVLIANVLSSVAQFEADVASERALAAYAVKRARGEQPGHGRKYGDRDGEDIDAVLDAYREAGSFAGGAKLLNERAIKPRNARARHIRRADGTTQEQALWWAGSVASIVRRVDPTAPRTVPRGAKAGGTDFVLSRLLRCPTCDSRLVGYADRGGRRVRYLCRARSAVPHQRGSVTEALIMPAIRAEASRLQSPKQLEAHGVDEGKRADLEARRVRILDMFEAGHIDKEEREGRLRSVYDAMSKLDAKQVVVHVPDLDWSWEARDVNRVLKAMFEKIELDPITWQPVAFEWTVPEWRSEALAQT